MAAWQHGPRAAAAIALPNGPRGAIRGRPQEAENPAVAGLSLEADGRTRTGDPFITRPLRRFAAVLSCGMKSLQTLHFCRSDMTAVYPPRPGFRTQ
jgi:hypothetical protein